MAQYALLRQAVAAAFGLAVVSASAPLSANEDDLTTALLLADVLRAARTEIASHQPTINNALVGDKRLTGQVILDRTLKRLREAGKTDPTSFTPDSREGKLLQAQMAAITEVLDENQVLINKKGIGFKGFVPAVFARLTNERFGDKAGSLAELKVTAPLNLVRNRKARPDAWEKGVIKSKFRASDWKRGQLFSELTDARRGKAFRVMVPEYYSQACLACHGAPKGEQDVTGYPKEGGRLGDLGGAISITLYQ